MAHKGAAMNTARITARVDTETQKLLEKASDIMGVSSINSFIVSAAVEKAKSIISKETSLKLSKQDTMLFIEALENPVFNEKLAVAAKNYESKKEQ